MTLGEEDKIIQLIPGSNYHIYGLSSKGRVFRSHQDVISGTWIECTPRLEEQSLKSVPQLWEFFEKIRHGDAEHQGWLFNAFRDFIGIDQEIPNTF